MKRYLTVLTVMALVAASCGRGKKDEASTLNDKKVQLEKLKGEQQKINDQVTALEQEIAKLDPQSAEVTAKLVSVMTVTAQNFSHYIDIQGKVDATNISYVAPPNGQGGIVKALYVTEGQSVRTGQVLARLDDQLIRQQIEPLRVQLSAAQDTYKRTKSLFDQGVGTYQNVLNAQTQVETLQKQINVIQKQASLMVVTSPASGIADQVNVRVGEMFVGTSAAGPQIRIVNTGSLKITAAVPENYLGRVNVGSKLQVTLPEENNRTFTATVNVVQKIIDPTTRTFTIEAKIPSDAKLKPNQVAQVRILDYNAPNVITVPLNVVQSDEKGKYVYIMVAKGDKMIASRRSVVVGQSYGDNIEIKSGLNAGDQVITQGYQNLYEGQIIATNTK